MFTFIALALAAIVTASIAVGTIYLHHFIRDWNGQASVAGTIAAMARADRARINATWQALGYDSNGRAVSPYVAATNRANLRQDADGNLHVAHTANNFGF